MKKLIRRLVRRLAMTMELAAFEERVRLYRRDYDIDPSAVFYPGSRVYGSGRFIFGARSYLNRNTQIQIGEGVTVHIGTDVRVGPGVRMYCSTADPDADFSRPPVPAIIAGITVGSYAWIGAGCYIGPGISIGENSVIGANSVVTRDVEPWEIVAGAPARHIRYKASRPDASDS